MKRLLLYVACIFLAAVVQACNSDANKAEADRVTAHPQPIPTPRPTHHTETGAEPHSGETAAHEHTGTSADSGTTTAIQVTVRAFLMRGENESSDYGLYSYVLFGARPTADTRPLYRTLIEVYMAQLTDAGTQATLTPTKFLNITYLPVADAPTTHGATISDPDWLLDHYDYPRAAAMLSHLNGQPHLAGPYIVSCKRPLSQLTGSDVLGGDYLFQDMTSAPPRLAGPWLQIFETQAGQEQYWIPDRRQQWVVRLRAAIADASDAVPNIQDSLTSWIAWIGAAHH